MNQICETCVHRDAFRTLATPFCERCARNGYDSHSRAGETPRLSEDDFKIALGKAIYNLSSNRPTGTVGELLYGYFRTGNVVDAVALVYFTLSH